MAARFRWRLVLGLTTPVAVGYGIHRGLTALETKYPAIAPCSSTSRALRTPKHPSTQHCCHVDVFSARVPVSTLKAYANTIRNDSSKLSDQDLQFIWARAIIGCRVLRAEGSLIGLFTNKSWNPGDIGDTEGGFSAKTESGSPQKLLHAFVVERPPDEENGLLVSWRMAKEPREFFEKIARWGYPWRLMSGGRHEISVSRPFEGEGDDRAGGPYVEVRFSAAHDYEIVPEEGGLQDQKTIPDWTGRLHCGFARFILDDAIRELEKHHMPERSR